MAKSAKLCNLLAACFENKVAKYINTPSNDLNQDIWENIYFNIVINLGVLLEKFYLLLIITKIDPNKWFASFSMKWWKTRNLLNTPQTIPVIFQLTQTSKRFKQNLPDLKYSSRSSHVQLASAWSHPTYSESSRRNIWKFIWQRPLTLKKKTIKIKVNFRTVWCSCDHCSGSLFDVTMTMWL